MREIGSVNVVSIVLVWERRMTVILQTQRFPPETFALLFHPKLTKIATYVCIIEKIIELDRIEIFCCLMLALCIFISNNRRKSVTLTRAATIEKVTNINN